MTAPKLILVVDDDDGVRNSLRALLEVSGYRVKTYDSAQDFLSAPEPNACCVITDIRMPGMDGLTLQNELAIRKIALPLIFITGHGNVAMAVRGMKGGAMEFLEKPFDAAYLLGAVMRTVSLSLGLGTDDTRDNRIWAQQQLALLTPREHRVFDELVVGHTSKTAAFNLGISPRTIEIHRRNIRRKLKVRSLAQMTRIACAAPMAGAH